MKKILKKIALITTFAVMWMSLLGSDVMALTVITNRQAQLSLIEGVWIIFRLIFAGIFLVLVVVAFIQKIASSGNKINIQRTIVSLAVCVAIFVGLFISDVIIVVLSEILWDSEALSTDEYVSKVMQINFLTHLMFGACIAASGFFKTKILDKLKSFYRPLLIICGLILMFVTFCTLLIYWSGFPKGGIGSCYGPMCP